MKMRFCFLLFFPFICLLPLSFSKTAQEWSSRTIYQVLTDRFARTTPSNTGCDLSTYCGGSFQGIVQHLDYIQQMGFDAIWISPVVTNTPNGYHGYWAKDFFKINPHFGTSQDLKNLVQECHKRNIWVMVDIVANHVGPVGDDFSGIFPFNQQSDYHRDCQVNNYQCFTDEIYHCRLADLPDLDQSNNYVKQTLLTWVNQLISNYSFDGLRIDTVPYINQQFWAEFQKSAGVYAVGEVESSLDCCVSYQKNSLDGILSYPMFFTLRNVFQNQQSMNQIQSQFFSYQKFPNVNVLGSFIDNHDHPRFLNGNQNKVNQYKSALVYVLLSEGIPIIYYGTEQLFSGGNDPGCREPLWPSNYNNNTDMFHFLNTVINFRKKAEVWKYPQVQRYSTNNFYAFTRGKTFVALTNQNNPVTYPITYDDYPNGTKLCNLFDASDCVIVQNKKFSVTLGDGLPKIYFPPSL